MNLIIKRDSKGRIMRGNNIKERPICVICKNNVKGNRNKYCSHKCYWLSKIGKPTWNDGIKTGKLPKEVCIKMGKSRTGKKNWKWKGGISIGEKRKKYFNINSDARKREKENKEIKLAGIAGRKRPKSCEICNTRGTICFDHCHETGRFRGWICRECNWALGHARDSIDILNKMIIYLERVNNLK